MTLTHISRKLQRLRQCLFARPRLLFFVCKENVTPQHHLVLQHPTATEFFNLTRGIPHIEGQRTLLNARFAAGEHACLTYCGEQLVHVCWWGERTEIRPDYELGPRCRWPVAHRSAVIYDCWTPPDARGAGNYPLTLQMLSAELCATHDEIWIYCLDSNIASRRGIEKAKFMYRGSLASLRILGYHLTCSPSPKN